MKSYKTTIPTEGEVEYIGNKLSEFNIDAISLSREKPFIFINRCIKDKNGEAIGGILTCLALWHILSIDTLWVTL